MATAAKRRTYLSDEALPGDWMDYSLGARSLPFISSEGGVGSFTLTGGQPSVVNTLFDRLSNFRSKGKDRGSSFQKFMNMMNNPDSIVEDKMKVPTGFAAFAQYGQ